MGRNHRGVGWTMEKLTTNVRGVKVSYTISSPEASETVVFLHGFTGSMETWNPIIEQFPETIRCISVDLLGHGETDSPIDPSRYQIQQQLLDLHELFTSFQMTKFTLIGYSMGGRVACAYALEYPDMVYQLILESASPGLKTRKERQNRIVADNKLAKRIEIEGVESFIDFWQDIPLFHSQKKLSESKKHAIRHERIQQSARGLANSLRGVGTGQQPSYWSSIDQLKMPVLLITGELDQKFNLIAQQMENSMPYAEHVQVSAVGHAIHVENPVQFATIIKEQLKDLILGGRL